MCLKSTAVRSNKEFFFGEACFEQKMTCFNFFYTYRTALALKNSEV